MKRTDADEIAKTLARMFGVPTDAERTRELAGYMERTLSCALCAAEMATLLYERIERFPTGKHVLPVYNEVNTSARHQGHLSVSRAQHDAGIIEAFWRKDAPRLISAYVDTDVLASWVAAEMWSSGVIQPTAAAVTAELEAGSMFVLTARHRRGEPTPEQVGEMFWAARQAATTPLVELDEATWNERVERIGLAMSWGSV